MNEKIMIIDGHPVYGPKMVGFFESLTFKNVTLVSSSKEAFRLLESNQPSLVLLSGTLPDANSLDLCLFIRQKLQTSVKIIIQTGVMTSEQTIQQFQSCGADAVVPRKEKDLTPLQEIIHRLLFVKPMLHH